MAKPRFSRVSLTATSPIPKAKTPNKTHSWKYPKHQNYSNLSPPLCHSPVYSTTTRFTTIIASSHLSSMAESESFLEGGTTTTSFSQLLFSNDIDDDHVLGLGHSFRCTSPADPREKFPKMLCFGGGYDQNIEDEIVVFSESAATTKTTTHQISGPHVFLTCSDTSSSVSCNNNNNSTHAPNVDKSNRKRQGSSQKTGEVTKTPVTSESTSKKMKTLENPSPISHPKPRKEKIGDRVTALQQLVSPFGKTDTASVLHEAMGYIRFLQDQVQVLSSPYLQPQPDGGEKDLRSRGLCLVPVECTVQVASCNGADY